MLLFHDNTAKAMTENGLWVYHLQGTNKKIDLIWRRYEKDHPV